MKLPNTKIIHLSDMSKYVRLKFLRIIKIIYDMIIPRIINVNSTGIPAVRSIAVNVTTSEV